MRKATLFLACMLMAFNAFAQLSRVTGTVLSAEDGEPIIGATVTVTGTNNSTATDADGKFTLSNLTAKDKSVTVTYIGMESVTASIEQDMTIKMHVKSQMMDEVVVVAFGKQKREAFTGSAGVLKGDEITKLQVNDAVTALDGKVAGVQILTSNDPSGEPEITIRGIGSLTAGTDPLIVVDGMPYNGYLRDINPADVDNISVLKDAASNALYGARGANGVVLITTKSAQRGSTRATVDMKWGANTDAKVDYNIIDNPGEYYEAQYLALRNYYTRSQGYSMQEAHIRANNNLGASADLGGLGYIVYSVPRNQTLIGTNGKLNPNATLGNRIDYNGMTYMVRPDNWRDYGIRDGFRQEYNVNLSGGNDKYSFYGSLGYLDNEGITYGSHLRRYTARLKTEYQAYPWMRIGATAGYTHTESDANNEAFDVCHNMAPIYPLFIRDGNGKILTDNHGPRYDYGDGTNAGLQRSIEQSSNPLQNDHLNTDKLNTNAFNMQGYANIDFLKDFRLTINGSVYVLETRYNIAINPYYGYTTETGGYVYTDHYRLTDTNFQQLLNWNHSFGLHTVEALIGHEYNRYSTTDLNASRNNVAMFDENIELDGAIVNGSINGNKSMYNIEGYFGRVQYDYDNRYFASASYRRDGSSRFHPDHRWGNFWSAGAAWIINKESWFPQTPAINMLKYKLSYGEQGNDNIGDFRYCDYYTIENSNDEVAVLFSRKGNPNITWETVGSLNTGVEFDLFNSRLGGSIEYYNRKTTDMLTVTETPASLGYTYYYANIGDMRNQGVEITLNATPIRTSDFTWTLNGNISIEKNRVLKLADDKRQDMLDGHAGYQSGWFFYGEGLPVYTWYMPKYAGVTTNGQPMWVSTEANADRDASGQPVMKNGQYATSDYSKSEYMDCGSALPKAFGGFGTTFTFYGVDLSAQFNFSIGGKKLDYGYQTLMAPPTSGITGYNIHRDAVYGSWSETNTTADTPRWQYADTYTTSTSDRFLTDASYLTFKSINAGYTLPSKWTKVFGVERLRVYFTVDNVAYWTKRKGFDPRTVTTTGDATQYSPMRTFMGGLNVQF